MRGLGIKVAVIKKAGGLEKLCMEKGGDAAAGHVKALDLVVFRSERGKVGGEGLAKRVLPPSEVRGLNKRFRDNDQSSESQADESNGSLRSASQHLWSVGEGEGGQQEQEDLGGRAMIRVAAALDPEGEHA